MPRRPYTLDEAVGLFWSRVRILDEQDCWPWLRYRDQDGYGETRFMGKPDKAHRVAYMLWNDLTELEGGVFILHNCDEPSCCNPAHLRAGDHADNMRDRAERGRYVLAGEANNNAKLTEQDVVDIREAYANGTPTSDLAAAYDLDESTINAIANGSRWGHLPLPEGIDTLSRKAHRGEDHPDAKLTEANVLEIRRRYANRNEVKVTQQQLADEHDVNQTLISAIVRRTIWTHI